MLVLLLAMFRWGMTGKVWDTGGGAGAGAVVALTLVVLLTVEVVAVAAVVVVTVIAVAVVVAAVDSVGAAKRPRCISSSKLAASVSSKCILLLSVMH